MLQKQDLISSKDFSKGLVTRDDMLKSSFDQTPNCSDIKWNFDGSIGKRFGSNTTNSVVLTNTDSNSSFIVGNSLTNNLLAYWKLDEASGNRLDSIGTNTLSDNRVGASTPSISGIRGNAVDFIPLNSSSLSNNGSSPSIFMTTGNFTIGGWFFIRSNTGNQTGGAADLLVCDSAAFGFGSYGIRINNNLIGFTISSSTLIGENVIDATSFGTVTTGSWYNVIGWHSNNSHIGISVNLSVTTLPYTVGVTYATGSFLTFGANRPPAMGSNFDGRMDEIGFWNRILTSQERIDLYSGGSGNTYTPGGNAPTRSSFASFDFGASSIRWLTIAAGTGILASSNRGTTFVNIASTRTATYQYLDRSRNVLIATSDAYDVPLYWAGSAGTFALTLAPNSAPSCKYSINYNGFLILLNSSTRTRGFFYADENLQLTSAWTDSFDIPSSGDDEITAAFILNKFLYVSTRYRIYRVQFVGGNPDWSYLKVKDFGYVPRTVKITYLKGGQVALGLDWDNRLRVFDGVDDLIISDSIENDNGYAEFAMSKISRAGSGLIISYSEIDTLEQEYRLGVAIGVGSTQTTHQLILNTRTLSFYPYSNQPFNTMVMAESNNTRALMAFDRSGYCHILNSGNLDSGTTAINESYDSPLIYKNNPTQVSKSHEIDLFFKTSSSGTIYYQDRIEMSNVFSAIRPLKELISTESSILLRRSQDIPSTQNIYQFRLTSSSGTANPWKLVRVDYLQKGLGLGLGNA